MNPLHVNVTNFSGKITIFSNKFSEENVTVFSCRQIPLMSSFTEDEWILGPVFAFSLLQYIALVGVYEVHSLMQISSWERKDLSQSS